MGAGMMCAGAVLAGLGMESEKMPAPDSELPAQDLNADQQARQAEVEAYRDTLRSTYNIVAESEGVGSPGNNNDPGCK